MTYTIAVIGARSGSKQLPGKNIRPLAGHPLLAYSIRAALLAGNINRVVVSTDSAEYAVIARTYGAHVVMRGAHLATDTSTDFEFIWHALDYLVKVEQYQNSGRPNPELVVHLRPTTPLRDPAEVARAVDLFSRHSEATALRSVEPMPESALKCLCTDGKTPYLSALNGSYDLDKYNDPRQQFDATYRPNGVVDVLRVSHIAEKEQLHGDKVLAYITPPVTEVDTEDDFDYLEWQVARNPQLVRRLFDE